MIIQDIYNRFEILPSLQLHMLRVAAVTQEICKQVKDKLSNETKTLITLSLLHDLGNLVKFDISLFPKLFEPKGEEYWTIQKQKTIERHGFPAELATINMCKELPITSSTQLFLELFLSSHFDKAIESKLPLEVLLIHFADMNIGMDGYIPRQERIQKLHTRFMRNKNYTKLEADHAVQQLLQAGQYTCEVLHSLGRDDSLMTAEFIDSEAEGLRAFKII